ncbi:MAG: sugar phosphate nucleotidyltransferase [Spirochaetes bacterium]|nr:sugar phosphate nucleotidyltransferase [Spirochaetota bacterium]
MKIIILAAGKGKRLHSEEFNLPKVLRELKGRPLIDYVIKEIDFVEKRDIIIVVGFMWEKVINFLGDKYTYVLQKEQLGTGHAVRMAEEYYKNINEDILVLMGDMPFIRKNTILNLIDYHSKNKNDITILSTIVNLPSSFGRIIRDDQGKIKKIIEVKDADEDQLKIREVNTGIGIYKSDTLSLLKEIKNDNNQKEYYLTDLVKIALEKGKKVDALISENEKEFIGINSIEDLSFAEKLLEGV